MAPEGTEKNIFKCDFLLWALPPASLWTVMLGADQGDESLGRKWVLMESSLF